MPEYLRALVVILALATVVFAFAKAPSCALAFTTGDFERRRNLWYGITLIAFLANNFWLYIIAAAVLLIFAVRHESNRLGMFFFLLFAVPLIDDQITGLGVIDHLFAIHYVRLLALVILLPAFLSLRRQTDTESFGRSIPDVFLAAYLILQFFMQLRADTFTNTLRHGVFYAFLDVFLPYYVASRSLKNLKDFRDALMGFAVAAMVLSAIGTFESTRHWLLYKSLKDALGVPWNMGDYLARENTLRALASAGHPIVLGYVIAVALGFFLFLKRSVPNRTAWVLGLVLLVGGLIAPVSRGPWVGAAAIFLVFIATGPSPGQGFAKLGLLGIVAVPLLLITPAGERVVDLLPFVGSVEEANVTYRQRLLEVSLQVIMQNPLFGTPNYIFSPEMQVMRQGEGIIDIVNTYLAVVLGSGLVGLLLFSSFFTAVEFGIFKGMRNLPDRNEEIYLLGRTLFSTLLGILLIIFTAASISVVPTIYWAVAGLGVAYMRMLPLAKVPTAAGAAS